MSDNSLLWKSIPRFPQYEVSNKGEVRRCYGDSTYRILAVRINYKGYPCVRIWIDNKMRQLLIHRAVAEAFIGPLPNHMVTNHIDGNKLNNAPSNLAYITNKDNIAHATQLGLKRSVIPIELSEQIIGMLENNLSKNKIAKLLNIGTSTIGRVIRNHASKSVVDHTPQEERTFPVISIPNIADHKWRPVIGYEGIYDISDYGYLRTVFNSPKGYSKGKLRKCSNTKENYLRISLFKDGQKRDYSIHELVAAAFLGTRPSGMQVDHKDGNTRNNFADNLEYVSPQTNIRRAIIRNIAAFGKRWKTAKLCENDVEEIRHLSLTGTSRAELGRQFNVPASHITNIVLGKKWKQTYVTT